MVLKIGYHKTYKLIDRGVIENLGPFGFSKLFYASPMKLNFLQTGLIYHSAFMMLVGIILLFILIGFSSWFGFLINLKLIAIFCVAVFVTVYIKTF